MNVSTKIIFNNKKNLTNYSIIKSYEFGIILTGLEVKSLRILNDLQLKNPHFFFSEKKVWIDGIFIRLCPFSANLQHKEAALQKGRKQLLLRKKEQLSLLNNHDKGITLLVDKIYWCKSFIKIKVAVAKKNFQAKCKQLKY